MYFPCLLHTGRREQIVSVIMSEGAGVAQSLYCLTIDWTTGVRSPAEKKGFSSSPCVQTSSEAQPAIGPIQWVLGVISWAKARPGRSAYHSPPSSPEVKMSRSYISCPWRLHGV
jgi:hypothetical protein